jgi:predicted permease
VLVAAIDPRGAGYNEDEEGAASRLRELHQRLVAGLEADPRVARAGLSRYPLHSGSGSRTSVYGSGGDAAPDDARHVRFLSVTHGYFDTLELPLLLGRTFGPEDREDSPPVAVVTRSLARQFFGGVEVVGRRFGYNEEEADAVEIVGVVEDFVVQDLDDEPRPLFFLSAEQEPVALHSLELRLRGETDEEAVEAIRRRLREVAPELPVRYVRPLRDLLGETYRPQRSLAILLVTFGAVALLLTAVGLYGVLAFTIDRRRRELGIRIAVGADRGRIVALLLLDAARLVGFGLLGGTVAALVASRWTTGFLFRLAPTHPPSIALACVVLGAVAGLAALVPALRAARVEPLSVLRHE